MQYFLILIVEREIWLVCISCWKGLCWLWKLLFFTLRTILIIKIFEDCSLFKSSLGCKLLIEILLNPVANKSYFVKDACSLCYIESRQVGAIKFLLTGKFLWKSFCKLKDCQGVRSEVPSAIRIIKFAGMFSSASLDFQFLWYTWSAVN